MPKFEPAAHVRVLYGIHPVEEALRAGSKLRAIAVEKDNKNPALRQIAHLARRASVPLEMWDRSRIFRACDSPHHQGVVAEAEPLRNGSLTGLLKDRPDDPLTVLLLDRVQDPQNLGNIFRTAEAAGVSLIFLPSKSSASHQLGSVAKASAGAVEHVPAVVVASLKQPVKELREAGFRIVGLDQKGSSGLWETQLGKRTALVVGAEGTGLGAQARELCDAFISVPMTGKIESLNVTNAVAVVLYETVRRRQSGA